MLGKADSDMEVPIVIADLVDFAILLLIGLLIGYPATLMILQAVQSRENRSQRRR